MDIGSGNPGALNAAQQLGPAWGVAVLVVDAAKGAAGAAAGGHLAGETGAYLAATTAIAGHIAPVWTRFRGGKGVATSPVPAWPCSRPTSRSMRRWPR